MMNKQLGKLLAAAQPEPPSVERFIAVLKRQSDPAVEACDSSMFPRAVGISLLGSKAKGTTKVEKTEVVGWLLNLKKYVRSMGWSTVT